MDLIRKYFVQIKAQLAGLTVSQKLLIGLLGIFLVGAIFWTVVWSAKPQMVPLIAQPMTPEEINKVDMALKGKYEYQVSGDKVLVPVEQAYAIRGELASEQLLPKNLTRAFDVVIRDTNMFQPESTNARVWNNALELELTRYLTSFPYVEDGSVIISLGQQQTLGRAPMPSTASVYVKTRNAAELSGNQVQAIAEMVSGSVSGMKREDVHVIVNGQRTYHAPDSETPMPADLLSYKKTIEDYLALKLEGLLSNYGDVKIAVNVVPDLSSKTVESTTVDPKNVVVKPLSEKSTDITNSDGTAGGGGQPGVQLNVTQSVNDTTPTASGRGGGSTNSSITTENKVVVGSSTTRAVVPAGVEMKEMTASISLPRSYFVSVYRRQNPAADPKADPKDEDLAPIIDKQIKSVREQAKNAISAKTDEQVRVDWYDDTIMLKMPQFAAASTTFASSTMPLISQYAKQGVLALIALGALGMMLRMVRRAVPGGADDVDTGVFALAGGGGGGGGKKSKKKGGVEQFDSADDVFGEANSGEAVLTGIELDDETLASRKMVDEVSVMIKENPENAAALVKRWMTKNK